MAQVRHPLDTQDIAQQQSAVTIQTVTLIYFSFQGKVILILLCLSIHPAATLNCLFI